MLFFDDVVEREMYYDIRSFPIELFARKLKRHYETSKLEHLFKAVGISILSTRIRTIRVHKFFIPEMIYLLRTLGFPEKLVNTIISNTWVKDIHLPCKNNRIALSRIKNEMNITFKHYQQEYIEQYDILKQKYHLNGYILSFEQGLGKTITALGVMTALGKKKVIIIAPKSTLETVWASHIHQFYNAKKNIYLPSTTPPTVEHDYVIVNYEAMDKIAGLVSTYARMSDDVGIIVDESHNFLSTSSNRTLGLINLRKNIGCKDILCLSGTPIKAIGVELIPMMRLLDNFFDEEAEATFKLSFGVNTLIATDVLRQRLSIMMHRKVIDASTVVLPPKEEHIIQVKVPGSEIYTLEKVKVAAREFGAMRLAYHKAKMPEYIAAFTETMDVLRSKPAIKSSPDFAKYLRLVYRFHKFGVDMRNPEDTADVRWANTYEDAVVEPALTSVQIKKFRACKTAYKYVALKITGEILGQFLTRLRMQMTSAMVEHAGLEGIIDEALKKTIIFTSYVDTVDVAGAYLKKKGYTPLTLHSSMGTSAKAAVETFIKHDKVNPLIASIQMLVTGVTLVVANTVIFMNKPWRHIEAAQASARIHRIGQDTECHIYTLILDTGAKPNLSTRMEEIMEWSKSMFVAMVGDGSQSKE
jgi:SNF2 family DNA or RNA helicase